MQRIDKYEILETVGRGAMGAVYKAFHPHLKKYVAIKEILADLAHDPGIRDRFAREAELLAQLPAHPNIVMVRDALVHENKLYLVMDYVEGGMLSDLTREGALPTERALSLLDQILSGLQAIHSRGIIHRDLKAGNILLGKDGTAYISDFGIAESKGSLPSGDAMATAKCVAPEVIEPSLGRDARPEQADIYAAGMLAYEMLLGESGFRRALPEIYASGDARQLSQNWLNWHTDLSRSAPRLNTLNPAIPGALAGIVERMMAKDTTLRYPNVQDIRRDLAALSKGTSAMSESHTRPPSDDATVPLAQLRQSPPPAQVPQKPARTSPSTPQRRIPGWAILGAGGVAVFLALAVGLYAMQRTPGFSIVVRGIAPGAEVYVNEIRRGIPNIGQANDGTPTGETQIAGLKAGELYALSVKCGGGELELSRDGKKLSEKLTAGDGDQIVIQAGKCGSGPVALNLPEEIEYYGKMRLIKAGAFLMGASDGKPNEAPVNKVDLGYDYYIDKFEVSNKEYADFCKATNRQLPPNPIWDPEYLTKFPNSPVVGVSWEDATAYASWAGKQLPTEPEWEKAASWDPRATGPDAQFKRRWPWGNTGDKKGTFGAPHTTPAGQSAAGASAYGVYDMAGNAAEWVADDFRAYAGSTLSASDFPAGQKVVRGGSFNSPAADDVRTTRRLYSPPTLSEQAVANKSFLIGFRCVIRGDNPKIADKVKTSGR